MRLGILPGLPPAAAVIAPTRLSEKKFSENEASVHFQQPVDNKLAATPIKIAKNGKKIRKPRK